MHCAHYEKEDDTAEYVLQCGRDEDRKGNTVKDTQSAKETQSRASQKSDYTKWGCKRTTENRRNKHCAHYMKKMIQQNMYFNIEEMNIENKETS